MYMKKIIVAIILAGFTMLFLSACASVKGRGCPTTNPRYFRG